MRFIKHLFLSITAFTVLTSLTNLNTTTVKAGTNELSTIPVIALGNSLKNKQRQQTIKILTQSLHGANYQETNISGKDLVKYLNPTGNNFTINSNVWSSAMLQKTKDHGVQIQIIPYHGKNNITTITEDQYANAALTAGIQNCKIYITSAIPIDGSSALAGVYKDCKEQGTNLSQKQIDAAQDELNTLSSVNNQNKGKTNFSDSQLNEAIAEAKKDMSNQSHSISDNEIKAIINNQLNANHLENVINNNQKNTIVKLLKNVRDSGALHNSSFKLQTNQLIQQINKKAPHLINDSKSSNSTSSNSFSFSNWFVEFGDSIAKYLKKTLDSLILI